MNRVERVNDPSKAPSDGVELHTRCVVTKFRAEKGGKLAGITEQELASCKILASMMGGTVGISIPGKCRMVSVRIDELMAVLMEAAAAANEMCAGGREAEDERRG